MIINAKMEDLCWKVGMVACGYITNTPSIMTYASMVSRDTVRIALMMAALHDLSVRTEDIMNAYIKAPCMETFYTVLCPEFGPDEGNLAVYVWAFVRA